ncbi:hypothetical protein NKH18_42365 [Streptomyces sp. M10(2022)]
MSALARRRIILEPDVLRPVRQHGEIGVSPAQRARSCSLGSPPPERSREPGEEIESPGKHQASCGGRQFDDMAQHPPGKPRPSPLSGRAHWTTLLDGQASPVTALAAAGIRDGSQ